MRIFCCGCGDEVEALLTDGKEVYPHRNDLHKLPFWKCEQCGNFVGCHHKTKNRTRPLGCIPTPEIKKARQRIHSILDPIWQGGSMDRNALYKLISDKLGRPYHTAEIRSIEEAEGIYRIVQDIGVIGCMNVWQPIETVPLDGTEVILRIVTLDESSRSVEVLNAWYDSKWQRFCNNSNCHQRLDFGDITHWMPLLKPSSE